MISKVRAKLGRSGSSTLSQATSIISNDGANGDGLDFVQQNALLEKWQSIRNASGRTELTGDRVLLAEGLRRELETITGSYTSRIDFNLDSMVPAEAHANYVNSLIHNVPVEDKETGGAESVDLDKMFNDKETMRLVVVSDTHGMERFFTTDDFEPWLFTAGDIKDVCSESGENGDRQLPNGDILLHLGDFAIDRGGVARRNALNRFDRWLSLQPHPVKIIVRGNHDPYTASFPMSKAIYVTKPTTMTFGSKVMAIIPFGHSGFSKSKLGRAPSNLLPPTCDILASHEPPYNILDL